MIKVTAVYRWREGATFDHDYYHSEHMRIARAALQPLGLVRLESDRVLYPGEPRPGQVVALTNAFFSDLKQAQTAAKQTMAELAGDIPNYTNIQPESYFAQMLAHEVPGPAVTG
ncbi:ethyl tert-butyl ether degradation protein EthD [Acidovorax sp. GW101-3H11]|uniref:EthD family reductase n=1 Tax=Acidovorax sp. GW101-3H11 TaxID=1813946 RepID=UPI0007B4FE85|nr:EthD family reductase [Acidovorax sp. GW101-3H11]KZT16009.1 ethyl tert-butyl ether degradation protein EthD [Acidovorax sp. GW101-3H11]